VRADMDDGAEAAVPVADELRTTVLGPGPSPLTAIEGTEALLEMDRNEVGTPLGDLEAVSPR
jgi:hypothetical protein